MSARCFRIPFLLTVIVVAITCQASVAAHAFAQGEVGIGVSPTHISPIMPIGDETRELVTIRNSSSEEMLVSSRVSYEDEDAEDALDIDVQPQEMTMAPGESAQATVLITASPDADVQVQRATALFMVEPLTEKDVSIAGQMAVKIDVSIIRPIEAVILSAPHFSDSNSPLQFTASGINNGNFPTKLESSVLITGIFARDVELTATSEELTIGEGAEIELEWSETPAFALRRVRHSVSSGVGDPSEEYSLLLIAPWRLALMLLAIAASTTAGALILPLFTNVFLQKDEKPSS